MDQRFLVLGIAHLIRYWRDRRVDGVMVKLMVGEEQVAHLLVVEVAEASGWVVVLVPSSLQESRCLLVALLL
jgi:hypothetical protein